MLLDIGSSPLVRGSGVGRLLANWSPRFIPARAGIGLQQGQPLRQISVHPRSCGDRFVFIRTEGSLPGSSPLVRGSEVGEGGRSALRRFIPARAGIGCGIAAHQCAHAVHPRSCGDRVTEATHQLKSPGSSPLVRGSARDVDVASVGGRFIPARAGIGCEREPGRLSLTVHPRSCGDRRLHALSRFVATGSSPLVRGSARPSHCRAVNPRFIPARAGIGRGR